MAEVIAGWNTSMSEHENGEESLQPPKPRDQDNLSSKDQAFLETLGTERLAAIERDYLVERLSINKICTNHGLSRYRFNQIRRALGWPVRSSRAKHCSRISVTPDDPPLASVSRANRRLAMINRLYAALERELHEFEMRSQIINSDSDPGTLGSQGERSARTLTSLVRSFEKIVQFDDKVRSEQGAQQTAAATFESDAGALRDEIARRLESLLEERDAGSLFEPTQRR